MADAIAIADLALGVVWERMGDMREDISGREEVLLFWDAADRMVAAVRYVLTAEGISMV